MRQKASLERVVATFRFIVIIGTALIAAMLALTLGTLSGARWEGGPPLTPLFGLVVCISGLLVLSRWGYLELKRELRTAAAAQKTLLDSAYRDSLTGAFTRSYFLAQLHEHLADQASPVAYMQIDMDNLKVLNDSHGHGAGDAALVHLVKTLGTLMPQALVGRLGGDEFGIAIAGQDNRAALIRLGDEVLTTLGRPISIEGRPTRLSATIGVALWPQDAVSADELVSKADLALYKGKKNGRALTVAFDPELLADERHKRFVERDLRAAILLNELELHYQPIYSANGRQKIILRGAGALAASGARADAAGRVHRHRRAERPDRQARRLGAAPGAAGPAPAGDARCRDQRIGRAIASQRFRRAVCGHSRGSRNCRQSVVIEVTETLQLHAGVAELRNIRALRALGVRIAIDDFGAGFASLEYLRGFPFDIIKIDRSYVANLPGSKVDGLIVSALCEIARSLHVEVIAEGIETEEQLHFLEQCGCTGLQGYLLARPAPLALATLVPLPPLPETHAAPPCFPCAAMAIKARKSSLTSRRFGVADLDLKRINGHVSVSPQISPEDVAAIKAQGFVAIINNRPDGESPDQPTSATIEQAAHDAGLAYHYIPLGREGVSAEMVEQTKQVLEGSAGPVFCYCRSGTRSTTLWALSQAGKAPASEIIAAAANAGYDMSHLAGHLSQ